MKFEIKGSIVCANTTFFAQQRNVFDATIRIRTILLLTGCGTMNSEWVFARRQFTPALFRPSCLLFVCACFFGNLTSASAGMISLNESVSHRNPLNQLNVESGLETWHQKLRLTDFVWTSSDTNDWMFASTTAAPAKVETAAPKIAATDGAEPSPTAEWSSPFDRRSLEANLLGTHSRSSGNSGCSGTSVTKSHGGCFGFVLIVFSQTLELPSHNVLGRLSQGFYLDIPSGIALEMLRPPQILTIFA